MRTCETIANIAAAPAWEIAEHCGISDSSARAVRAAAQPALEDSVAAKKRLTAGRRRPSHPAIHTAELAAEALAEEYAAPPEQGG